MHVRNLDWILNGCFAHRGLHNIEFPENSMPAFINAVKKGYDVELDIRITKDNKLVVCHDSNLNRLTGCDMFVEESTLNEVLTCNLLNTDEKIPLLNDVLNNLSKNTKLLIELKSSRRNKALVKTFLELIKNFSNDYAIHSFDPRLVNLVKKTDSSVIRGQISKKYNGFSRRVLTKMRFNFWTKPDFINYKIDDLPNRQLDRLKRKGMIILSYTARSEEQLAFVKSHYDNAVFEGFEPVINK